MCGLVGAISNWLSPGEIETFQHLAMMATFRGKIGGGVAIVPVKSKKNIDVLRDEDTLAHLVLSQDFVRKTMFPKNHKNCIVMGHARLPTKGDWSIAGTHPHVFGNIIGMHNGTLKKVDGKPVGDKENDSELFFKYLSEKGIELAIKNVEGAYALSWIDQRAETLNFLRNDDRPLFFGHYEGDTSTMYWSSEAGMLHYVLNREKYDPNQTVVIKNLPPHQLVSMRLRYSNDIKPVSIRTVKPFSLVSTSVPAVSANSNMAEAPLLIPFVPGSSQTASSTNSNAVSPNPQQPSNIIQMRTNREPPQFVRDEHPAEKLYETKDNSWMTERDLNHLLKTGCHNCQESASIHDYWTRNELYWYKDNEFMCHNCMVHDDLARQYAYSEAGVRKH